MKAKPKRKPKSVITSHLRGISRALLVGEKRPTFLEFLNTTDERSGLYALYDKAGRLYYAGKASDLSRRLDQHLADKHAESWVQMTLFFIHKSANVPELEGLIIAAAKPTGNKQNPKIGKDIRKSLERYLQKDAALLVKQVVYPDREPESDKLFARITAKKLVSVGQRRLADVLGISQGRVSQLFSDDRKHPGTLRRYIRETGKRDSVLLLLQKQKKKVVR